jgi:effector-binding domain-containing protein
MFKIGEFSKLSHVTTKTLRYYDEIGLLKPAEVDRWTGYRYYSAGQLARLNRILALKDLGLALDEIAHLLQGNLPAEQIRGILRLKQVEIQRRVADEQARLARVEARLRQIEQEAKMSTPEVALKKVPAQTVASIRTVAPNYAHIGQLFGEAFGYLGQRGITPVGPPMGIYHDEEFREQDVDIEVAVPVAAKVAESERVKQRELPAGEMACAVHTGSYETIGGSYGQLMAWVEANGYRPAGPVREVYLRGPESGGDPSTYVTEIQLPVTQA